MCLYIGMSGEEHQLETRWILIINRSAGPECYVYNISIGHAQTSMPNVT